MEGGGRRDKGGTREGQGRDKRRNKRSDKRRNKDQRALKGGVHVRQGPGFKERRGSDKGETREGRQWEKRGGTRREDERREGVSKRNKEEG
jgi:hypothetical protein